MTIIIRIMKFIDLFDGFSNISDFWDLSLGTKVGKIEVKLLKLIAKLYYQQKDVKRIMGLAYFVLSIPQILL